MPRGLRPGRIRMVNATQIQSRLLQRILTFLQGFFLRNQKLGVLLLQRHQPLEFITKGMNLGRRIHEPNPKKFHGRVEDRLQGQLIRLMFCQALPGAQLNRLRFSACQPPPFFQDHVNWLGRVHSQAAADRDRVAPAFSWPFFCFNISAQLSRRTTNRERISSIGPLSLRIFASCRRVSM